MQSEQVMRMQGVEEMRITLPWVFRPKDKVNLMTLPPPPPPCRRGRDAPDISEGNTWTRDDTVFGIRALICIGAFVEINLWISVTKPRKSKIEQRKSNKERRASVSSAAVRAVLWWAGGPGDLGPLMGLAT
ncbi:hypothetical protein NQZ68_013970 [Dissostichus eleginoides]|nr:hypothetical protein NQZ68_013970 [Dissostichus eleginoides]